MEKILAEKNGTRSFERLSKWHILDYVMVTRKSSFARYATGGARAEKLDLLHYKVGGVTFPYFRSEELAPVVVLEDGSQLTRKDTETDMFLEVDITRGKVRLYREIK